MPEREGHEFVSSRNLLVTTVLNLAITIAEFIGGLLSNSLALLSDALHNLSDTLAILLAYIANRIAKKASNKRKTFGYKRIEILAAFLNSLVLIVISIFLFVEAVKRFQDPEPIKGQIMFIVAGIGLLANLFSVLLLRKSSRGNLNIKSAYLHLIGDTLSSVAVIIGGVLIYFYQIYWVDPVITILIGLYIMKETWHILKKTVDILMQGVPESIDVSQIKLELERTPEVENIHHVHIWNLSDRIIHFECHAKLAKDIRVSETGPVLKKIEHTLRDRFNIRHITVQFEFNTCDDKETAIHQE